jgi:type VI secretion system protein ImpJ
MTTRRLNPVAWLEGMFLRPHHLQHHDLFEAERLRYHLHAVNPFHWGVRELVLDEEALSDNRLVVLRLDAVLPGGTIVRYPGNAMVETRDLDPSAERVEVFVGLRHVSPAEPNTAPAEDGRRDVRGLVRAEELPDLNRGGFETPIDLLYPNVRLFLSAEDPELEVHESFKLAEIVATGELKSPFALSTAYCPPLLSIQAFPPLADELTKIVSQIAAKVRVVAGRTATVALADLRRMWMRYTLARMAPVLRHLLSVGETRPFELYTALVETAGALAAFELDEAAELPVYDHEDLHGCFQTLLGFIQVQLDKTIPERYRELPMPYDGAKKHFATTELNVELVDPRNLFFLGIKSTMDSAELASLVVEHGKASSRSGVQPLVMLNTQGLRLEQLPAAPTEIGVRPGYEYFKVEPHGAQWNKVREDFSFALNLGKLEDADVRLYVVVPEG